MEKNEIVLFESKDGAALLECFRLIRIGLRLSRVIVVLQAERSLSCDNAKLFSKTFVYPLALGGGILIYYAPVRPKRRTSLIENRKLEIKENCNVYRDARRKILLSVYGRTTDALASGGDEGRGRLRQALGSRQRALIQRFPNGTTRHP